MARFYLNMLNRSDRAALTLLKKHEEAIQMVSTTFHAANELFCAPLCSLAKVIAMLRDWFVPVVPLGEEHGTHD
jgi:hypothetical protein